MPVIPALGRLKQKDHKFEVSLGYIVRLSLIQNRKTQNKTKHTHTQTLNTSTLPNAILSDF
jgi:hypothetical protein